MSLLGVRLCFCLGLGLTDTPKRPTDTHKRPMNSQKKPMNTQKRPMDLFGVCLCFCLGSGLVCKTLFTCMPWLIHMWAMTHSMCAMTHSYVGHAHGSRMGSSWCPSAHGRRRACERMGCNNHKVLDCSYGLCMPCCAAEKRTPQCKVNRHYRNNKNY